MPEEKAPDLLDFANISGQRMAKRMLQTAAAGNHNCILMGPPGIRQNYACKCIKKHIATNVTRMSYLK
jgi:predicted ATPase with chaperone activity